MNLISFDILYKKKLETDVFKLSSDSELHQLKLMISGKYRIYNIPSICLLYKSQPLLQNDSIKLRDIFKNQKKVKLELNTEKPSQTVLKPSLLKYLCKCKTQYASYICDKCDEFVCETCLKKKKHIAHIDKLIKINEYIPFVKTKLKDIATSIDERIINDESYQFLPYWSFDLNSEIENINKVYEYLKSILEDIKEIQIEYLINVSSYGKYDGLKKDVEGIIKEFSNVNIDEECEKVLSEKKRIEKLANGIMLRYKELKSDFLKYANVIKEIQVFNDVIMKDIKEKVTYTKKKFYISNNNITTNSNSQGNNKNSLMNKSVNDINTLQTNNKKILNDSNANINNNNTNNLIDNNIPNKPQHNTETLIFKLKDSRHILIFSLNTQSFKERTFIDSKSLFKSNLTTHTDITQLNLNNTLYLLSGKSYNKLFQYEYSQNKISFITTVPNSHYYGSMIHIPSSSSIYFIAGNNQIKNDKYSLTTSSFESLPNLNEKRQEFACILFNNFIYVFFGFSPDKGSNLSSIERMDVNKEDKFEVVYINEQITLSGFACARCVEEDNNESEEVLILGGFDGKNYVDTTLLFNAKEIRVKDCDVVIPNMRKHGRFLFQRESMFVKVGKDIQAGFDMNNNVHLITKDSYELFSEVQV